VIELKSDDEDEELSDEQGAENSVEVEVIDVLENTDQSSHRPQAASSHGPSFLKVMLFVSMYTHSNCHRVKEGLLITYCSPGIEARKRIKQEIHEVGEVVGVMDRAGI